MENVMMMTMSS